MKKRIFAMAVVTICIAILASTTLAYFTDTGIARNVITAGGIGIQILEQQLVDGTLQTYPGEPVPIMPGSTISKIVSVQCTEQPAWIRANYTVAVYNAAGEQLFIPSDELSKVILTDVGSEWIFNGGWWYYTEAVKTGDTTAPLFKSVTFSGPNMDNDYQNCTAEILVTAQAVQQANNGSTVTEALGWPET